MQDRRKLIESSVGRMPPFKPELRARIRTWLKTQTRRIVEPQPPADFLEKMAAHQTLHFHKHWLTAPYSPGIRFMIEPLMKGTVEGVPYPIALYKDDGAIVLDPNGDMIRWRWAKDSLSSIHMPTTAARFFVDWHPRGIEHVQSITEEDAIAEGCTPWLENGQISDTAVSDFAQLWNEINAARGYDWQADPFVRVYQWENITQPQKTLFGHPVVSSDLLDKQMSARSIILGEYDALDLSYKIIASDGDPRLLNPNVRLMNVTFLHGNRRRVLQMPVSKFLIDDAPPDVIDKIIADAVRGLIDIEENHGTN